MQDIQTRAALDAAISFRPLVIAFAYASSTPPLFLETLEHLQVVTSGVFFLKFDAFANEDTRELKRRFAIARLPSVLFFTHGALREISIAEDAEHLLKVLSKWYKTVYSSA